MTNALRSTDAFLQELRVGSDGVWVIASENVSADGLLARNAVSQAPQGLFWAGAQ